MFENLMSGPLFQPPAAPIEASGGGAVVTWPAEPPAVDDVADIFTKATVLQLQFRRLGTERKVSVSEIDVRGNTEESQADKALLKVSKSILESPELKAIERHDGETARFVDARKSGPAFANQGGFHLVALAVKPAIDAWLDQRLAERGRLVDDMIAAFPTREIETRRRLGPLALGVKWPELAEVRAAFGVTVRYMSFGYTDEGAARAWRAEALTECRQALRAGFRDLVDHLAERLTPGADGKPKTFRDSLVSKFDEFVASFEGRNLANDAELAALVTEARTLMAGVSAGDLRGKEGLRSAVKTRIDQIKRDVDGLVMEVPTRRYAADGEE